MFWFPDTHLVNAKLDLKEDPDKQWTVAIATCCSQIQIANILQLTNGYPFSIQCLDVDFELHGRYILKIV